MNSIRSALAFLCVLATASASASDLDLRIPGGQFEDCEFVGLGPRGSLSGSLTLDNVATDPKWAAGIGLILLDDNKFQTSLRLALTKVTTSSGLEARYEFFSGNRRPVAEALDEVAPGVSMPFALAWSQSGRVELTVGRSEPRNLLLDFSPTRAFVLISGGQGKIKTNGAEVMDCAKTMNVK